MSGQIGTQEITFHRRYREDRIILLMLSFNIVQQNEQILIISVEFKSYIAKFPEHIHFMQSLIILRIMNNYNDKHK